MMIHNGLFGFNNHFQSEARPGALPLTQNSPQHCAFDLVAEQFSLTSFTSPRHSNRHTWLYRLSPSVKQSPYEYLNRNLAVIPHRPCPPDPIRLNPLAYPEQACDFIDSLIPIARTHPTQTQKGVSLYIYRSQTSMQNYIYSADGEWLIIPQEGKLKIKTELGILIAEPGQIALVPRGMKMQIHLLSEKARGYLCENHGAPFTLPELGPLGANALANPRHFQAPNAAFEETGSCELWCKFQGELWKTHLKTSPLNVVAWHGNAVPYLYDLRLFNTINTVSFDHPDPSIFTVLTSPSAIQGVANCDFVIFPERWMVAEHSFRLPYYHRNIMSECMGLIYGKYDAKTDRFSPGGLSIHNCMTPHGPDTRSYEQALKTPLKPQKIQDSLAFMLETPTIWEPSHFTLTCPERDRDYQASWI